MTLREQRTYYAQQLLHIESIKRLQHKFSTIQGYMYCIGEESRYKRELTRINSELELTV